MLIKQFQNLSILKVFFKKDLYFTWVPSFFSWKARTEAGGNMIGANTVATTVPSGWKYRSYYNKFMYAIQCQYVYYILCSNTFSKNVDLWINRRKNSHGAIITCGSPWVLFKDHPLQFSYIEAFSSNHAYIPTASEFSTKERLINGSERTCKYRFLQTYYL